MINFKEYLTEARLAPLYHGTDVFSSLGIIDTKMIGAHTAHLNWKLLKAPRAAGVGFRDTQGVSLTRSFNFAAGWGVIVFEVDQQKLNQRMKIIPINYWSSQDNSVARPDAAEYEEFAVTNTGIPLTYVKRIYIKKATWESESFSDERKQKFLDTKIPISFYDRKDVPRSIKK